MTRARDLADSADKDIAGTLAVDGLDVAGNATIDQGANGGNTLSLDRTGADGTLGLFYNGTQTGLISAVSGGGINAYVGSTPSLAMSIDANKNVGIGGTTASATGFARSLNLEGSDVALQLRETTTNTSWEIGNDNTGLFRVLNNGSDKLKIDSSGRVTMPAQPSFSVSRNGGDVSSGTYVFAHTYHNTGNHYSTTTGRFTAPISGLFFFSTNMMSSNATTYNNAYYEITKNGSGIQRVYSSNGGSVHHRWNWSGVIYLNANDYITVDNPGASSLVLYGSSIEYTAFTGFLVG